VYHAYDRLNINHQDNNGQDICESSFFNVGSSVWYRTGRGLWVWSGGTDRTDWNRGC